MSFGLPSELSLTNVFAMYDTNHNLFLSRKEASTCLQSQLAPMMGALEKGDHAKVADSTFDDLFATIDLDHSGHLSYSELERVL
mmetsp:Transcript_7005/g.17944  ORF Transcript_7005/g.17944 Transcript_7005/m.17944 type:complete len:84 (-) Transcript_7005:297-548(-)